MQELSIIREHGVSFVEDLDYQRFIGHVKVYAGIDLSQYKEAQMKRRLTSLRNKRGYSSFQIYWEEMQKNRQLYHEFIDRITINVSEFFRNPERWKVLEDSILPKITENKRKIRCWSAACSTGEEPYSLALILNNLLPASQFEILATDIDENALMKAKQGIYQGKSLKDVPKTYLAKYFTEQNGLYHIRDEIKKLVRFKKHNLLSEPFEGPFDLIICRNVMIYFTDDAKNMLYHKFSEALAKDGILFVGSTEQIFQPKQFHLTNEAPFFYRRMD